MAEWSGKSRGSETGHKIFVLILKRMGILPAYLLLCFVALYYFLIPTYASRQSYSFFRKRLGFSRLKSLIGLYKNFFVFGQTLIDRVAVMAGYGKFSYTFEGEEYLLQMSEKGQGGILISAHLGNWEIAGHLLYRIKAKINIVMFDGERDKIKAYLEKAKGQSNVNIIAVKEDMSHIYEISEAFENKEIVCIHGDRYVPGSKVIKHEFLGEDAYFPVGPLMLASKYEVPVSFVFAMKETRKHYHLYATEPEVFHFDRKNQASELIPAMNKYVKAIEKIVVKYPFQWFNYYDFWKREKLPLV